LTASAQGVAEISAIQKLSAALTSLLRWSKFRPHKDDSSGDFTGSNFEDSYLRF
jgi:hypothetical protein